MIYNKEKLFKQLEKRIPQYPVIETRSGGATIQVNQSYLHSKYDPVKQGKEFAENVYKPGEDLVLYGLGLGYHAAPIADMLAAGQLLVILEFNLDFVKLFFEVSPYADLFDRPDIVLVATDNLQEGAGILKEALAGGMSFVCYEPAMKGMPEQFNKLKDAIEGYLLQVNSHQKFAPLLHQNHQVNITKGYENGLKKYKNAFTNRPCVIVSAGPSLRENAELLRQLDDQAIVLAVGRSANYIQHELKIKPTFYIMSEGQETAVYYQFLHNDNQNVPLFFLSTSDTDVELYQGEKYMLFTEGSAPEGDVQYAVDTGGSVATTATSLAYQMGCNPIVYIGQDLCYTEEFTHADHYFKVQKTPLGKYVKGIDGQEYYTTPSLYRYLRWIEWFIAVHKDREYLNCTAKGAYIQGAKHLKFADFIAVLPEKNP